MMRLRPAVLLLLLSAACSSSEITSSFNMNAPLVSEARVVSSASYTPTDLGGLPGDEESIAWAVNDRGSVAIQSTDFPSAGGRMARWYVQTGSTQAMLNASIRALSNGAVTYVAGYGDGAGQRWTYSVASGFSASTVVPGMPRSINDLGDIGGETTDSAVIMKLDGTTISVANPNPSAFPYTETRDINNSGDIVISYQDGYVATPDRGYLRTADGVMIELTPLAGHNSTYVRGLSDEISGKIYVAGTSDDDNGKYNAVRWTVDIATHAVTSTEVGAAGTVSVAMSNDGMLAGVITGSNSTAFVWKRGGSITTLKTPKGLSSGRIWGVSGNGNYIAGDGMKGTYRRAVLWTAQ